MLKEFSVLPAVSGAMALLAVLWAWAEDCSIVPHSSPRPRPPYWSGRRNYTTSFDRIFRALYTQEIHQPNEPQKAFDAFEEPAAAF